MSKIITTTSEQLAQYLTWTITDLVLNLNKTDYRLPTWEATKALKLSIQKDIEQGAGLEKSAQAMKDLKEILLILESIPGEPLTA